MGAAGGTLWDPRGGGRGVAGPCLRLQQHSAVTCGFHGPTWQGRNVRRTRCCLGTLPLTASAPTSLCSKQSADAGARVHGM